MRVVELFAGIGGMSLAAEWMGWEVAAHVEIDPFCTRVLQHHWPDALHFRDIKDVRGDEFGAVDLICGGPPCQPYSVAGKQRGNDDDRALWPHVVRIVGTARPSAVCFENVTGVVRLALDGWLADLEALGYACWTAVIPAAAVGAPHKRDRVWVVGLLDDAAASRSSRGSGRPGWPLWNEARRQEPHGRGDALADAGRRGRGRLREPATGHESHGHDPGGEEEAGRTEQRGAVLRHPDGPQQGPLVSLWGGPHTEPARDRDAGAGRLAAHADCDGEPWFAIDGRARSGELVPTNAAPRGPRCDPASWPTGLPARGGQERTGGHVADANGDRCHDAGNDQEGPEGEPLGATLTPGELGKENPSRLGERGSAADATDSGSIGSQGVEQGGAAPRPTLGASRRAEVEPRLGEPHARLSRWLAQHRDTREAASSQAARRRARYRTVRRVLGHRRAGALQGLEAGAAAGDSPPPDARFLDRFRDPRWQGEPLAAFGETWEDGVPRVTAGCEHRVSKLKALGNALVPQVAFQIFRAIEAERSQTSVVGHTP